MPTPRQAWQILNVRSMENKEKSSWPIRELLICYLVGAIFYSMLVDSLDLLNGPRYLFIVGLSVIYWGRIILAIIRKESNKAYRFYALLILLSPLIWGIIETIDHKRNF